MTSLPPSNFKTLGKLLAKLKAIAMLDAARCMLNILGDNMSAVEIHTLVDTLVKRQAKLEVKSLKNTRTKRVKEKLLDTLAA